MERKSARSAHNEAEPLHLASEHENVFSSRIDCNVERYFAADAIRAYAEDGPDGNVAHAAPIDVRAALAPRKSRKKQRKSEPQEQRRPQQQRLTLDEATAEREFVRLNAATFGVMRTLPKR